MLTAFLLSTALAATPTFAPSAPPSISADWTPAPGPLRTRWTAEVQPQSPWNVYPRPQFERAAWQNLNGLWEYQVVASDTASRAQGKILVPYPIESQLSGVGRRLAPDETLICHRTVQVEPLAPGERLWLHFGAVDWNCAVQVNGQVVGRHSGGFDPFSFDITEALPAGKPGEPLTVDLHVQVTDPTDAGPQPRGKQTLQPKGIFYTPVSGIWQTVWMERVPARAITALQTTAERRTGEATFTPRVAGVNLEGTTLRIQVTDPTGASVGQVESHPRTWSLADASEGTRQVRSPAEPLRVTVQRPVPWSPENPALYTIVATLLDEHGAALDTIKSYCAFRDIARGRNAAGEPVLLLNGEPYFMLGLLDQGWWPDGLYTPPTHEAMLHDLQVTRQLGFNTIRKHVKVEHATWYAACDRMGILVWQDMPSGDGSIGANDPDLQRTPESAAAYERELRAMVRALQVFPCIVVWIPFNEGWGQFDSARITSLMRSLDPSRLVTTASGWTDRGTGDLFDTHDYAPRLAGRAPQGTQGRPWVLGECGGFALPEPGHMWKEEGWGYTRYANRQELTAAYEQLAADLQELRADGLAAAIYTQTTDVETEINGVMTYDRDLIKFISARMAAANRALITATVTRAAATVVVPSARDAIREHRKPPEWRMTLQQPAEGWTAPQFNDRDWLLVRGGFGTQGTPGTENLIHTIWSTSDIWLRRTFRLPANAPRPTHLSIHHDDDAEVWIDGLKVAELKGYTTGYVRVALPEAVRATLNPGNHNFAVHCRQGSGGQYIDVGLLTVDSTLR